MKCFSLFSGIGGFDLALENQGHEMVGACEIDKYARQVYAEHFRVTPWNFWKDATKINPIDLPDFDILTAGFPCQAFSIAGRRLGFEESRGTLFFEIARIAREKRPKFLLLENVKGLLSHDRGKTFANILATLDELGYDAEWQVLNSKYFVPQNRERIFIIGYLRGEPRPKVFPIRSDGQEIDENRTNVRTLTAGAHSGGLHSQSTGLIQLNDPKHSSHRVYHEDGLARALKANTGAKTGLYAIAHTKANMKQRYQERDDTWTLDTSGSKMAIGDKSKIRRLTPLECERLQGFPDGWTEGLSDTQRYKCMGNAVTVPVVEYILERLVC